MKKKNLIVLLTFAVICLTACGNTVVNEEKITSVTTGNTSETLDVTTEESASEEVTEALPSESVTEETTSNDNNSEYSIEYVYPDDRTEEQAAIAEKVYEQVDNTNINTVIDAAVKSFIEEGMSEELSDIYTVYNEEYYADFNNDGNNEMFIYRYVAVPAFTPAHNYRELWYTDGNNVEKVLVTEGRCAFSGLLTIEGGPAVFYAVPVVYMGAPWQPAQCYIVRDGKPVEYILPDENQYFAFYDNAIFISTNDEDTSIIQEKIAESEANGAAFQELAWVDGELRIIAGYGVE